MYVSFILRRYLFFALAPGQTINRQLLTVPNEKWLFYAIALSYTRQVEFIALSRSGIDQEPSLTDIKTEELQLFVMCYGKNQSSLVDYVANRGNVGCGEPAISSLDLNYNFL